MYQNKTQTVSAAKYQFGRSKAASVLLIESIHHYGAPTPKAGAATRKVLLFAALYFVARISDTLPSLF